MQPHYALPERQTLELHRYGWGLGAAAAFCLAVPVHAQPNSFDCLIEPAQMVEVGTPASGLLEKVLVKRGDKVAHGQVLAVLDNRAETAAAQLARFKSEAQGPQQAAKSKIDFAQRKVQRRSAMAQERLGSVQDRDDAEAELALAKSELLNAQEAQQQARLEYEQQAGLLALRTVRSPFNGVVVDQMLYPGEIMDGSGAKKAVLKLAQLDPLRVRVIVPMQFFGKVKTGSSAEVVTELNSAGRYTANVKAVDRLVDAGSGTFAVFLEMPNKALDIPSGVKCQARLQFGQGGGKGSAR